MVWYMESEERYIEEVKHLLKYGFIEIEKSEEKGVVFGGNIKLCFRQYENDYCQVFKVHLILPPKYPFAHPEIVPIEPEIKKVFHQNIKNHQICILEAALDAWRTTSYASEYIKLAKKWFKKYLTRQLENDGEPEFTRYCLNVEDADWIIPPSMFNVTGKYGEFIAINYERYIGGIISVTDVADSEILKYNYEKEMPESLRTRRQKRKLCGVWVKLKCFPKLITTYDDLIDAIESYGEVDSKLIENVVKQKLYKDSNISVGLFFTKNDNPYWFFYTLNFSLEWVKKNGRKKKQNQVNRLMKEPISINGIQAYPIRPIDLYKRNEGCIPERITTAKVVIVGCGALGSMVAQNLARSGVNKFVLYDFDVIHPGNLMRHTAFLKDVGRSKVCVVRDQIMDINPFAEVEIRSSILDTKEAIKDIQSSTIVVCCVVNNGVERYVDHLAGQFWKPVVFSRVMLAAKVARIFLIEKDETPCFDCLLTMSDENAEPFFYLSTETPMIIDTGCGGLTFPGSGINHQFTALYTCQMIIGRIGDPDYSKSINHILWVNEPVGDPRQVPYLQGVNQYIPYLLKPVKGCVCDQD